MTKRQFASLEDGAQVWFSPPYFAYGFPAVVKTVDGVKGVYVNFFGDGQCLFSPHGASAGRFLSWVSPGGAPTAE